MGMMGRNTAIPARGRMDRTLVERARDGDRDAFAAIAADAIDRMFATARAILRDADRAQDATQEALVRCWRDLPTLKDPNRFDAWLRRLLVHAVTDEIRRGRRFDAKVRLIREDRVVDPGAALEERDLLDRAFRRLSVDHRSVLVLHHLQGLSLPEVAETLEIPLGTAKSRLHYAIDAVRASLDADARSPLIEEVSA
jgi:RNA polymerase sigma-70 factor (ECF subfamily)